MLSLIVGLGNPGAEYVGTRHNIGFEIIERVALKLESRPATSTRLYDLATKKQENRELVLARPRTFMNRSGEAVADLLDRYQLEPSQMLVIVDDYYLPLGAIRFRKSGSNGGHNGLGSVVEAIGTQDFPRMRVGIGPLPDNINRADFVLSQFEPDQLNLLKKELDEFALAVIFALHHSFEEVMGQFNRINPV